MQIQDLTPKMAEAFRLNVAGAALVAGISPDSPAACAGVRRRDVITVLNGKPVNDRQLQSQISMMQPGSGVRLLTVLRDGRRIELPATPAEIPSKGEAQSRGGSCSSPRTRTASLREWGARVLPLPRG